MTENQDRISAVATVVDSALAVDATAANIEAQAAGYEAVYVDFVTNYLAARDEGASQKDVVDAVKAEATAAGTAVKAASAAAMQIVDVLADFHGLDGDLPTVAGITFVYRPNANGPLGVAEGESSVYALIRLVAAPESDVRPHLKKQGVTYGKAVAASAVKSAKDKAEAIANLQALLRSYKDAVKASKDADKGPTKAEKYLKAASGPLSKVTACIDADEFDSAEQVRELANAILAEVNAVLGHSKIKD